MAHFIANLTEHPPFLIVQDLGIRSKLPMTSTPDGDESFSSKVAFAILQWLRIEENAYVDFKVVTPEIYDAKNAGAPAWIITGDDIRDWLASGRKPTRPDPA